MAQLDTRDYLVVRSTVLSGVGPEGALQQDDIVKKEVILDAKDGAGNPINGVRLVNNKAVEQPSQAELDAWEAKQSGHALPPAGGMDKLPEGTDPLAVAIAGQSTGNEPLVDTGGGAVENNAQTGTTEAGNTEPNTPVSFAVQLKELVGEAVAVELFRANYKTAETISGANDEQLKKVRGVDDGIVAKLREAFPAA